MVNVGKYTSPMDPVGIGILPGSCFFLSTISYLHVVVFLPVSRLIRGVYNQQIQANVICGRCDFHATKNTGVLHPVG